MCSIYGVYLSTVGGCFIEVVICLLLLEKWKVISTRKKEGHSRKKEY